MIAAIGTHCRAQATRSTTSPTTQPSAIDAAFDQFRRLQQAMRSRDGEAIRTLLTLGSDPDAAHQLDEFVRACTAGRMIEYRAQPFEGHADGDVMAIAAAFLRRASDPEPDLEVVWFLRRHDAWHMLLGGTNERGIMTDVQRASADRLEVWYRDWLNTHRDEVREKLRSQTP